MNKKIERRNIAVQLFKTDYPTFDEIKKAVEYCETVKPTLFNQAVDVSIETSRGYYDSVETSLVFYGYRKETDEEALARIDKQNELHEKLKLRELQELERLQKKYGNK